MVERLRKPVTTEYELFQIGWRLAYSGKFDNLPMSRVPKTWDKARLNSAIKILRRKRVIVEDHDFKSGVWRIVQATSAGTAEEVCCLSDPFCYVSHLSAMQRYGLTNRSPHSLHLTTPSRPIWSGLRDEQFEKHYADYPYLDRLKLLHYSPNDIVRGQRVIIHVSSSPAAPILDRTTNGRIASIGRTFLDMISEPHLCGGMPHVVDAWTNHANAWIDQIIPEIDKSSHKLTKVRAGYLISERLGLSDHRVEAWKNFSQRGGSQKLDPEKPYSKLFSETWKISINVQDSDDD